MLKCPTSLLLLLLAALPAQAGPREDCLQHSDPGVQIRACGEIISRDSDAAWAYLSRGNAYFALGDNDRAIADYTESLKINPVFAWSYSNRGNAYHAKGDLDRAIADHTRALKVNPSDALTYNDRGFAYWAKGDNDRAIADYGAAIKINRYLSLPLKNRGRAYFYLGALGEAYADFTRAYELNPKDAYSALWLDRTARQSRQHRLREAMAQLDMSKWPAPIVQLFVGDLTAEEVFKAANHQDPKARRELLCEANFYVGVLALGQGRGDDAVRLFRLAEEDCPPNLIERTAARAELRALGAKRP